MSFIPNARNTPVINNGRVQRSNNKQTSKKQIFHTFEYFFLCPDKKRIQSSPDEEVRTISHTVSPFQIKDVIPSGGKNVSIFTHRLPFRESDF